MNYNLLLSNKYTKHQLKVVFCFVLFLVIVPFFQTYKWNKNEAYALKMCMTHFNFLWQNHCLPASEELLCCLCLSKPSMTSWILHSSFWIWARWIPADSVCQQTNQIWPAHQNTLQGEKKGKTLLSLWATLHILSQWRKIKYSRQTLSHKTVWNKKCKID